MKNSPITEKRQKWSKKRKSQWLLWLRKPRTFRLLLKFAITVNSKIQPLIKVIQPLIKVVRVILFIIQLIKLIQSFWN